jgi:hypothetical protein
VAGCHCLTTLSCSFSKVDQENISAVPFLWYENYSGKTPVNLFMGEELSRPSIL